MHTVEKAYRSASELYWIAFLLTGHEELSLRITINALGSEKGLEGRSSPPLPALRRTLAIQNALAATQAEITASAKRFAAQQSDQDFSTLAGCFVVPSIKKTQIEKALLAIDLFPRCALLLTVFEGLPLEEAAILLHCDRDLIERGRIRALRGLTRNLSSLNRITPVAQKTERAATDMSKPKHQDLADSLERVIGQARLRVSRPA
jgi:hypothetical protein